MRFLAGGCALILVLVLAGGCGVRKLQPEKLSDLEYTILTEEDIPEAFLKMLEEKKDSPMMLTYLDDQWLYLGVGYGTQATSGYSITVDSLYVSPDGIYLDTTLYGPKPEETVSQVESFPYLVLRTERREESVIFE